MTDTQPLMPDDAALDAILGQPSDAPLSREEIETVVESFAPHLSTEARQKLIEELAKMSPHNQQALIERLGENYAAQRVRDHAIEAALAFTPTTTPEDTTRRILMAWPQCLFKVQGLWLWGADKTTLIHNLKVGNQSAFNVSSSVPLPGLYFEAGMSFADFEQRLEKLPGGWTREKLREVPAVPEHQKITLPCAEIGNNITLDVEGPVTHAVMWGKTIQ